VKNPRNGYAVAWLHYSADPMKNPEWAEKERASYPSLDLWNQEMEIDFTKASGRRVFPMFNEDLHIERNMKPIPHVPIWRFWDFGWYHPACVFAQVDGKGILRVMYEMLGEEMSVASFGKAVLDFSKEKFMGWPFRDAGDPAGVQKTDKSNNSSIDILRDSQDVNGFKSHHCGPIRIQYRKLLQAKGIGLMHTMLLPAPGTGEGYVTDDGNGVPPFIRMILSEDCEDLIDGFMGGYRCKENSDEPLKDGYYDHLFDALRYGCQVIFDHITCKVIEAPVIYKKRRGGTQDRATGY